MGALRIFRANVYWRGQKAANKGLTTLYPGPELRESNSLGSSCGSPKRRRAALVAPLI